MSRKRPMETGLKNGSTFVFTKSEAALFTVLDVKNF